MHMTFPSLLSPPGTSSSWLNETDIDLPKISRETAAGIAVAIAGNILISLALNCQKLAHRRIDRERETKAQLAYDSSGAQNGHKPREQRTDSDIRETLGEEDDSYIVAGNSETAISEAEPLLSHDVHLLADYNAGSQSGSETSPDKKRRSRFSPLKSSLARAERAHVGTTHALLPVDVLPVQRHHTGNSKTTDTHDSQPAEDDDPNESDYLKSKLWWIGFMLMNVGELGNFISYAFAPASVVAPLGTFALIANCLFAPVMLGERFRKRDVLGILVAIIGAVTVVLSANPSDARLDPTTLIHAMMQHAFIIYTAVYIIGAAILVYLSEREIGKQWVYVDVGLCALFGGFTVLSTKAISTLLTMEWLEMFTEWITYPAIVTLLGTAVCQIKYLNRALMRFDSKIVIPTQFVFFNLSAILGSAILYGDFKRATFHQIVTFLYGCAATFAGVFIITWAPRPSNPGGTEEDEEQVIAAGGTENRRVHMGSLARRNRLTLIVPEGVHLSSNSTPVIRRKQSVVSILGFSPAQRILLIHTPPHDNYIYPQIDDVSRESPSTPDTYGRRRAASWLGEDSTPHLGARKPLPGFQASAREHSRSHDYFGQTERSRSPG